MKSVAGCPDCGASTDGSCCSGVGPNYGIHDCRLHTGKMGGICPVCHDNIPAL